MNLKRVIECERALLDAIAAERLARITVDERLLAYREAVRAALEREGDAVPGVSGAAA